MKRQMLLTAVVSALAASAIAGGISLAASPGDGGVIQGCYDSGGNLKVVAAPPCPKSYTALAWNQQGTSGPKGDKGDKGDQGEPGIQGPPGAPGVDGKDGVNGTNGSNGANGTDGADGAAGVSVTSAPEPAGENCTNGGSKFTSASGITYACNGVDGADGAPGGSQGRQVISARGADHDGAGLEVTRVDCPIGKWAQSGGFDFVGGVAGRPYRSAPDPLNGYRGWVVAWVVDPPYLGTWRVDAWVICVDAS